MDYTMSTVADVIVIYIHVVKRSGWGIFPENSIALLNSKDIIFVFNHQRSNDMGTTNTTPKSICK